MPCCRTLHQGPLAPWQSLCPHRPCSWPEPCQFALGSSLGHKKKEGSWGFPWGHLPLLSLSPRDCYDAVFSSFPQVLWGKGLQPHLPEGIVTVLPGVGDKDLGTRPGLIFLLLSTSVTNCQSLKVACCDFTGWVSPVSPMSHVLCVSGALEFSTPCPPHWCLFVPVLQSLVHDHDSLQLISSLLVTFTLSEYSMAEPILQSF